jgi:enoyl-CoA hydratase
MRPRSAQGLQSGRFQISAPSFECLTTSLADGIAEIRFTRPALMNRFDARAHEEFIAALAELAASGAALRVLIVTAEGRVFSAGGDFDEMLEANASEAVRAQMSRHARGVLNGLIDFPVPVISAVQGAAIGLGATIASLADVVVAWRGAKIADTHVAVGLVAGDGGVVSWSQAVGVNRARRYLLTGDILTGEQAHAMGLVTDLADTPEEVGVAARDIAERIRALPADGVNGTRRAFAALIRARANEAFELGLALEMQSMASPGVKQTIEKLRKS